MKHRCELTKDLQLELTFNDRRHLAATDPVQKDAGVEKVGRGMGHQLSSSTAAANSSSDSSPGIRPKIEAYGFCPGRTVAATF